MRKSALITSALLSALATGPVAAQSATDATGMSPADETMVADPMATGTEAAPAASDTAAAAMTSTYTCPDGTSVATADAQCADDRWYLAPFATFMQPGGDRKAFGAWGGGMGIGKVINEWLNLEIRGFWMNYSNNRPGVGGQTDVTGGSADALFFFDRDVFSPYAVASLGANNTSYRTAFGSGNTQPMFQWQFGVGATYELADNFLLRSDVRYQGMFQNGNTIAQGGNYNASVLNDLVVNAGFVIPLGEKPVPVAAAAPAAVDDCSTKDSDGDGVNDCDDKCPGTMKGAKVDEYGCLVRIELRGVNFHYDSAELTETAKGILDEVSTGLIASGETKDIEVQGHTSTEGTDQYNMKLSQRRAASVVDYLKMKGVPNNLYPKGYGEMYPKVSPDRTEEERSVNRRVELVWMGE
ncbi:OmpA family protein [Methylotetracoccus oryzae]|uniref:OmpA family protein n=1 Tax=Methylotetracoccus oryzae TaxID=1919059 RepID=UPI001F2693B9|nr:OmpA family protein [Methylotetracoccus oryzae]